MLEILRKSFAAGIVTTSYPETPPEVSIRRRGRPEIDFVNWKDARASAAVCPTGAIACEEEGKRVRAVTLDLGKCIFCGLCADVDASVRMTHSCELAARRRDDLKRTARYHLRDDGTQERLEPAVASNAPKPACSTAPDAVPYQALGSQLRERVNHLFGRSLHIREVDAGSCNGCEIEINGLNSPNYDVERFGVHFVASPRHADMLLVTGPVSRNMELALRKTYDAMPGPRLVVGVGACGCSGGIFGRNYATLGGVDQVIPVDVYIPGCPPNPYALLHGILTAIGRLAEQGMPRS
jgi:Ni,Fe-hydrogenase III small subunit/formate hydrogenlyase subunit 6/NADH:ubiquinone oxidoreductase subunit I